MSELDGIERETGPEPDLSIVWLHGLGADATDFLPLIGELELAADVRFVFPNAPMRPVTINAGYVMRAWYDIAGFGPDAPEDTVGLSASVAIVRELIDRELRRGIARDRLVLAGFSQGGAVVLHAGLTERESIGGIVGLSTYLPAAETLASSGPIATGTPVMLAHGTEDAVIPIALAEQSARFLLDRGVGVDWSTYPMGHEVSFEEIRHLSRWFRRFEAR
ncbi:MAG TPA: alpha/beta hydrolase [Gammaproteobacteria bacterium]|nr:alpha/beta hydrolase [Gammaproteobacteria bacterium]